MIPAVPRSYSAPRDDADGDVDQPAEDRSCPPKIYVTRLPGRPARSRNQPRARAGSPVAGSGRAGVVALVMVAVAYPVLWVLARPGGQPLGRFLGELCGAEAVLLFSCSLVLATLLAPIERAFGGLDRVAVWHRRAAVAGVLLLIPHVALVSSAPDRYATSLGHALGDIALIGLLVLAVWALAPSLRAARWPGPIQRMARATYERWLTGHRLTGLFVIVAVVHGAIVDPVLRDSVLLRVAFLIVGAAGTIAYLYRELLARYVVPIYDYTVADVRRPNKTTLEVDSDARPQAADVCARPVRVPRPRWLRWLAAPSLLGIELPERSAPRADDQGLWRLHARSLRPAPPGDPRQAGRPVRRLRLSPGRPRSDLDRRRNRRDAVSQLDPVDRRAVRPAGRLLLLGRPR